MRNRTIRYPEAKDLDMVVAWFSRIFADGRTSVVLEFGNVTATLP
jgi:hypothetical protein